MATSEKDQPKAAPDKSAAEYEKTAQQAADKADKGVGERSGEQTGARRTETTARTATGESARSARSGDRGDNPFGGVADELRESHERRTTVPGADNVDARLDNRRGADRPPLEEWPAKPQQVDGPDVMGQVEHTRRTLEDRDRDVDMGERKGMFSPGPHGLSDVSEREDKSPEEVDEANEKLAGKPSAN